MPPCNYPKGKGQLLPIVLLTQLTICKGLRFSFLEGKNATTSPLDIYKVAKILLMVDLVGFEPTTSSLQGKPSPNWYISPNTTVLTKDKWVTPSNISFCPAIYILAIAIFITSSTTPRNSFCIVEIFMHNGYCCIWLLFAKPRPWGEVKQNSLW